MNIGKKSKAVVILVVLCVALVILSIALAVCLRDFKKASGETSASAQSTSSGEQAAAAETDSTGVLDRIIASGVLRVGTAGDYQPMSFLDPSSGQYIGFDAELAEDLAEALGVDIEYVETSWPPLMDDTLAGRFDLAICGITVTDARKEQALMSVGYLENGKTVLCRAEDADKYISLEAINRPEVRVIISLSCQSGQDLWFVL